MGVDNLLDNVIVKVSEDLLNDIPAGDPRWSDENQVGIGSSYSMQITKQLEDKQKALRLFYKFLRDRKLWERLSVTVIRGTPVCTVLVLGIVHMFVFVKN